jgi:hypothetical protein
MEEKKKNIMKFKDYYQNNEFKEKHKAYMLSKVPCEICGYITARCNMTRHRSSRNCNPNKNENIIKINALKEKIAELTEEIRELYDGIKGSHININKK